jgi:hypothetical protein
VSGFFNQEARAARRAVRQQSADERKEALIDRLIAANPQDADRWEQHRPSRKQEVNAERQQRKDQKQDLKEFVRTTRSIQSFQNVHLYQNRIIKLPVLDDAECRPIVGTSASVEETGTISSRSTLTRSLVPGMHGWQKKTDNRKGYVVIEGPDFQWQIEYLPQLDLGGARKFVTAVNTAARSAAGPAATPATAPAPDPLDQLRKLAELRDAGIVTNEEFDAKKAQLLS